MLFTSRITGLALAGLSAPVPAQDFGFSDYEIYRFQDGIRDLVAGDFDGDGDFDLALVNDARSRVEVLVRSQEGEPDDPGPDWDLEEENAVRFDGRYRRILEAEPPRLARALGFRIFEDQAFGAAPDLREPRELLSADLTGDDKDDLAVLVHDKLIVYVQE